MLGEGGAQPAGAGSSGEGQAALVFAGGSLGFPLPWWPAGWLCVLCQSVDSCRCLLHLFFEIALYPRPCLLYSNDHLLPAGCTSRLLTRSPLVMGWQQVNVLFTRAGVFLVCVACGMALPQPSQFLDVPTKPDADPVQFLLL